jgi:putative ABC transport system permease protein
VNIMRDDLKAAFRSLRSSPGLTIVALIVLTLGIGATTAIFSVVDAVVLRGLPFDEHDRLVAVGERRPLRNRPDLAQDPLAMTSVAPQNYRDWLAQQQVFESMAAVGGSVFTLYEPGGEPEDLRVQRVTASFFAVLRRYPALGRAFTSDEEADGRHRVVVLSHAVWQRRFGGDAAIIGRSIPLQDDRYEVVGIMPPDFTYPIGALRPTDLWVPLMLQPQEQTRLLDMRAYYLQVIARLKPGVSPGQAQAQMDQIAKALEQAHPEWNKDSRIGVRPLPDHLVGTSTKSWMLMLLGTVAIVLLIACANVANLLLARASAREREVGIRAALGAGRWRLVRQLMVESLVLSIAGTTLAIVVAWWGIEVLRTSMPENVPRVAAIAMNLRVLVAAAGLSVITGLIFGVTPALQLSKPDLSSAFKDGARGSVGTARQRLRSVLVVVEVALAVVLLVGAALFIGSFVTLMRIDPGFNPEGVLMAQVYPRSQPFKPTVDTAAQFERVLDRLSRVPGVLYVSTIVGGTPFSGTMSGTGVLIPGRPEVKEESASFRRVTPAYHHAMGISLRKGRLFEPTDRRGAPLVAVVNELFEKKYFKDKGAIGHSVELRSHTYTIVGVVGDVYQTNLETAPREEVYVPQAQVGDAGGDLIIRTSGDPYAVLPEVKAAVREVFPDVPLRNVRTIEELMATRVAQRRLNMLLIGLFGLLGLVISGVGIYGVVGYAVSQRTREIGIRMALGASRRSVMRMILTHAGATVGAGLVIGAIASWYLTELARAFLFRLDARDPRAFVAALLVLGAAALLASAIPARRAASVDPMIALRAE